MRTMMDVLFGYSDVNTICYLEYFGFYNNKVPIRRPNIIISSKIFKLFIREGTLPNTFLPCSHHNNITSTLLL